jgi:hypothetical protein
MCRSGLRRRLGAVGVLLSWRLSQDRDRDLAAQLWQGSGYVFTDELGAPVLPDRFTRTFEALRKRVNTALERENADRVAAGEAKLALLPRTTLHGLRHEHASLWIAAGGDISQLSKRLGHSSISVTSDIYVSRVGAADRVHAEQVAAMIPRSTAPVHTVSTHGASEGCPTVPRREKAPGFRGCFSGRYQTRTDDLFRVKEASYQLRQSPIGPEGPS